MSSRPSSGVREVLESIAKSVGSVVDDLSGETDRLRRQLATDKAAAAQLFAAAAALKPVLPAHAKLKDAFNDAKAEFDRLEMGSDPRPAIASLGRLRTAAQAVDAVSAANDLQFAAMNRCADWDGAHNAELKPAIALKTADVTLAAQPQHKLLMQVHAAYIASLDKPDFVDAERKLAVLGQRLSDFVAANSREAIRDAKKDGKLGEKLKDPGFLKQAQEWMKKADPKEPEQRGDMLGVLKAMDPAKRKERQEAFELTFATKIAKSEERHYEVVKLRSGQPSIDPSTKKPRTRELPIVAVPLDPRALDALTEVMSQLPTQHMPGKWSIEGQTQDKGTTGSFDDRTDEAILRFSLTDLEDGMTQEYTNAEGTDPLKGAKAFDVLIRHECGHKAAAVAGSEALTNQAIAGAWVHHNTGENVLKAIGGPFQELVRLVQAVKPTATEADVAKAVGNPDNGFDAAAICLALKVNEGTIPDDHIVLQMLQQGFVKKFYCGSSPVSIDGRMYVWGGPGAGSWYSFDKANWDNRVSFYQFAAPNEWFAEFYATANNGKREVRDAAKKCYPKAWEWLETHDCIVFKDV